MTKLNIVLCLIVVSIIGIKVTEIDNSKEGPVDMKLTRLNDQHRYHNHNHTHDIISISKIYNETIIALEFNSIDLNYILTVVNNPQYNMMLISQHSLSIQKYLDILITDKSINSDCLVITSESLLITKYLIDELVTINNYYIVQKNVENIGRLIKLLLSLNFTKNFTIVDLLDLNTTDSVVIRSATINGISVNRFVYALDNNNIYDNAYKKARLEININLNINNVKVVKYLAINEIIRLNILSINFNSDLLHSSASSDNSFYQENYFVKQLSEIFKQGKYAIISYSKYFVIYGRNNNTKTIDNYKQLYVTQGVIINKNYVKIIIDNKNHIIGLAETIKYNKVTQKIALFIVIN
jgi:hypothetical protein